MTNEEKKSNEIATEYLSGHDRFEVTYEEIREAVLEMAKWKDHQFKEYLEKRKKQAEEATKIFDDELHIRIHQSKINLINEIINVFFKEEQK